MGGTYPTCRNETILNYETYVPNDHNEQIEISKISLYPNPATEYFYIEGLQQTVNVSFYSMDGKHIKSFEHNPQSPIQTKDLNSGSYLVSIKSYVDGPTKLLIINK